MSDSIDRRKKRLTLQSLLTVCAFLVAATVAVRCSFAGEGAWRQHGFDDFSKGVFGNGGQNLYVSRAGVLQRIFQFDLNRDGFLDLVICNSHGKDEQPPLYVYSDALAAPQRRLELPGDGAVSGDVADLNGDGFDDLIIAMADNGARTDLSSYLYFGSPEGFSEQRLILLPTPGVLSTAAGDFNGDGKQDVAFQLPGRVRVFYQTELGFEAKRYKELAIDGVSLVAERLVEKVISDLVVRRETGDIAVYRGSKDGLSADASLAVNALQPIAQRENSALATFLETRDEALPLAKVLRIGILPYIFIPEPDHVRLMPVHTDGKLGKPLELDCPKALAACVGDLDGDGYQDLVVATRQLHGKEEQSWVYWGSAGGLNLSDRTVLVTRRACDLAVTDLDGDGCDDVVFCQYLTDDSYSSKSYIYRGSKSRQFTSPTELKSADARRVLVAHGPENRTPQLVFVNRMLGDRVGNPDVSIFWGDRTGFAPDRRFDVAGWGAIEAVLADLNDDGRPDLVLSNCAEDSIWRDPGSFVYFAGTKGIDRNPTLKLPTTRSQGMACGDVNRDGYLDLISCGFENPNITIFLGSEQGWTSENIRRIRLEHEGELYKDVNWVYLADLNSDGWLDLVAPMITRDRSFIFWGGPDGFNMQNVQPLAVERAACARAADFLKNGRLDLILGGHNVKVGQPHDSFAYLFWNGPEGFRQDHRTQVPSAGANSISVADFNNDGTLDFYVGSYHAGLARDTDSYIYWNRKGRGFSSRDRQRLFTHSASGSLAADFNEDGWIDLATAYHKVDGRHIGWSAVWWNGPDGFDERRTTKLPSVGPHGITCLAPANQRDGGPEEFYESSQFELPEGALPTAIDWKAEVPPKTWLKAQIRAADSKRQLTDAVWVGPKGDNTWFTSPQEISSPPRGRWIQYRLALGATNGVATPRITEVSVAYKKDDSTVAAAPKTRFELAAEQLPWKINKPIVDVNRQLYRKQEHPEYPLWIKMYSTGPKGQRWEVAADESSGADVWENIRSRVSNDNGRTWSKYEKLPNNIQIYQDVEVWEGDDLSLPLYDPKSGLLVQTWLRQIQVKGKPHRNFTYYRLSRDFGRTWSEPKQLKYEPGPDFDPREPLNPEFLAKNNAYLPPNIWRLDTGDLVLCVGSIPNPRSSQKGLKGEEMGAICFTGHWNPAKSDYEWTAGAPVFIEPQASSRGLMESNTAELRDGRLLVVWRASNAGMKNAVDADAAGRKLFSLSNDGGKTLSAVQEWKYSDGSRFYSPSSFHRLFRHKGNKKLYWIGNICPDCPSGNHPRFPLVIAEVDEEKAALKKHTVTLLADRPKKATDRFQLSNFSILENSGDHTIEVFIAEYDGGSGGVPRHADCYKYTLTFR